MAYKLSDRFSNNTAFLILCISGVPKHTTNPALFEVILGGLAANFIYWSLVLSD